jgi:resuscitation-promoting factor RpfA
MSNHDREGPQPPDKDAARDGSLTHAWQRASDERPPPGLDAAIIAAARKSVQDRGAGMKTVPAGHQPRNRWMQWQPLAAAATVAGLAFILAQLMPRDRDVAPPIRMEESAPRQAAEAKAAPDSQGANTAVPEPGAAAAPAVTVPQATVAAPAPAPARSSEADTAAAAGSNPSTDAAEADQRKAVVPEMAGRAASAVAPAPAPERSPSNEAPPGAADRAARIAALYASGDVTGAADALRAFRAADPDADTYLADSLRGWARTVK